jgi:hypothetical protein
MLIERNLPRRKDKPEPLAIANSLVVRNKTRILAVAILIAAVSPIAAMAVMVVTVVVDTVVTISLFLIRLAIIVALKILLSSKAYLVKAIIVYKKTSVNTFGNKVL